MIGAAGNIVDTGAIGIHILVSATADGGIIVTTTVRAEVLIGSTVDVVDAGAIGIHILVSATTVCGVIVTFIVRAQVLC